MESKFFVDVHSQVIIVQLLSNIDLYIVCNKYILKLRFLRAHLNMVAIGLILWYFPWQMELTQMAECVLSATDELNFQESFHRTGMRLAHLGSSQPVLQDPVASIYAWNQSPL